MNERIKELKQQATIEHPIGHGIVKYEFSPELFAELIVKECADFVRETYDHEAAESIAWTMEIEYGLHGDYA